MNRTAIAYFWTRAGHTRKDLVCAECDADPETVRIYKNDPSRPFEIALDGHTVYRYVSPEGEQERRAVKLEASCCLCGELIASEEV